MFDRIRKLFFISLLVVVIAGSGGCRSGGVDKGGQVAPRIVTLRIVATNDIHGALTPGIVTGAAGPGRLGGIEYLAGIIERLRAMAPERTIVLDAGDCFQGDYAVNASEGSFCTDYFNTVGYTARTIGNHEFDYLDVGPDIEMRDPRGALKRMIETAGQPVVLANARLGDGSPLHPALHEYRIVQVGGVRVGITGVLTPDTPNVSRRAGSEGVVFEQPVDALKRVVGRMRAEGAQVVVVLSHLGGACQERRGMMGVAGGPCEIAGELVTIQQAFSGQEIDLIVAGHDHVLLKGDGRSIPVMETPGQGFVAGLAEIDVDISVGRRQGPVRVSDPVPVCPPQDPARGVCGEGMPGYAGVASAHPGVLALRLAAEQEVAAECSDVVAVAETDIPFTLTTEPPLSNLAADLLLGLGTVPDADSNPVPADFAFLNRGSTRTSLPAGPITVCGLARVWPFTDAPVLLMMTGAEISAMMSFLIDEVRKPPAISGMRVLREGSGPLRILDRDGGVIVPERTYRVVTTRYMLEGGDRLDQFFRGFPADRVVTLPFGSYRDGFADLLRRQGTVRVPDTGRYSGVTRE